MKKIINITFTVLLTIMSSCSMELTPEGSISDTNALMTVDDYQKFGIGLNSMMRSITSGDYVVLSDIQLDDFNAVIGNGNRRMEFYNGQIYPSTGEISSIYSGYYSAIAQTNFVLQNGIIKIQETSLTNEEKSILQQVLGTAYFFRAYCYSALADKFCQSYKNCSTRDKEGTGLSLQLVYHPTADTSKYPGRSSLVDTYKQIVSDINNAITMIEEYEQQAKVVPTNDETYVNSDAAKALLARVYLNMGDDSNAAKVAEALIGSERYPLISNKKQYHDMWFRDSGTEIIWKVSADKLHCGSETGIAFYNNDQNPDYVPNNDAIYLFEESDTRWYAWFDNTESDNKVAKQKTIVNSGGSASMFLFAKYPGNPILQISGATSTRSINMGKPLRIGEMYLIAAEANANMGEEIKAKDYLSQIESARSTGKNINYLSGSALMEEIYNERHRELMGEGMRQADLKRWNIGFTRSDAFDGQNNVIISNYRNLRYYAGDYRLTWPIPQHEIEINPQLAGQQNEGY